MTVQRRRVLNVDDPVEPRRPPLPAPAGGGRVGGERPGSRALFVRLALEEYDAVARAAFELDIHKRELVAALIHHYVNPHTPAGLAALSELLADDRDSRQGGSHGFPQAAQHGDASSIAQ